MSLRYHVEEIMRINPTPSPWPRMFVCTFATVIPLIVGWLTHQMPVAILGSLTGFLLVLNDHMGSLGHRLLVITLTYIILALGLTIGLFAGDHKPLFVSILLATTYWLGLMGGQNTEFEKAILFSIFQLLAGAYSSYLKDYLGAIATYSFIGYITVIVTLTVLVFVRRHTPNPFHRVRTTIKDSLTLDPARHAYALCYTLAVLAGLIVVEVYDFSHGYWAVGTVLIIMRPSFTQSIYRLVQRLLGTVLGVLVAEVLIYSVHSIPLAIAIVALVSFWGPWALARSYWLGSTVVSIMILMLLDIPHLELGDLQTPIMRLIATGIGCALSLAGAIIANPRALFSKN